MVLALLAFPLSAHADTPLPPAPDARFALALYCNPTCDESVADTLQAALSAIPEASGFAPSAARAERMMGIAGAEFGIPDADFIARYGVDVDRPERLALSQEVLLGWFVAPRGQAEETFAIAHAAFAKAAAESVGWVEDLDTQTVYGASAWASRDPRGPFTDWFVVDAVLPDATDPDASGAAGSGAVAASGAEDPPLRLVTRGLRRYGDYDLVVPDVPAEAAGDVSFVLNSVAESMHRAASVQTSFGIDSQTVRGTVTLVETEPLLDDPEGPLLRVSFAGDILTPDGEATPPEGVAEPVAAVMPSEPRAAPPSAPQSASDVAAAPTPAPRTLADVRAAAAERLEKVVHPAWDQGLPANATIAVSAPFTTRKGGTEYIWVELRDWSGGAMSGVLVNEPYDANGLHKGDVVSVQQDQVYDYIWRFGDGSREGNTTAAFLKP